MKNKIVTLTILAISISAPQWSYSQDKVSKVGNIKNQGESDVSDSKTLGPVKAQKKIPISEALKKNKDMSEEGKKELERLAEKLSISPSMMVRREGGVLMVEFSKEPSQVIPDESFISLPDGTHYLGSVSDNNIPHGLGIFIYRDKAIYEGQISLGKKNGRGKISYSDGTVKKGEWVNDKFVSK